jgi:hypothetical protein
MCFFLVKYLPRLTSLVDPRINVNKGPATMSRHHSKRTEGGNTVLRSSHVVCSHLFFGFFYIVVLYSVLLAAQLAMQPAMGLA